MSRIHRLVELIGLLQSGRAQNARELAGVCGVSRRTIFRDLRVLESAGSIASSYSFPPTNFGLEQALSLVVLCYSPGAAKGLPFQHHARAAPLKLGPSRTA